MKRLCAILIALALILVGGLSLRSEAEAASEGTMMSNAVVITFGKTYTKTWTKDTDHLNHYSKITVKSKGYITITATKPFDSEGEYGGMDFVLYDEDGNPIWGNETYKSVDDAKSKYVMKVGLDKGVYYLTMKPDFYVQSGTIKTEYVISFTENSHCEIEPNGSAALARKVELGEKYIGWQGSDASDYEKEDYFKFEVVAGTTYRVSWENYAALETASAYVEVLLPDGSIERLVYDFGDKVDENGLNCADFKVKTSGMAYLKISRAEYNAQFEYGFIITNRTCALNGHKFGSWQVTTEATCQKEGVRTRTCSGCGTEEKETVAKTGHTYGAWNVTREATCKREGEQQRTCTGCGKKETSTIALKAHNYGSWTEKTPATCTVEGELKRTCSGCGAVETKTVEKKSHAYGEWKETTAATCTDTGEQRRVCDMCGKEEARTTATKSHNYGNWEETIAATCTADGERTRSCESCGKEEKQSIAKVGHTYGEWITSSEANCEHEGQQTRRCTACGNEENRTVNKTNHTYGDWTVTREATCSTKGEKVSMCTSCGTKQTVEIALDKNKHTPGDVATKNTPQVCLECNRVLMAATGSGSGVWIAICAVVVLAAVVVVVVVIKKKK